MKLRTILSAGIIAYGLNQTEACDQVWKNLAEARQRFINWIDDVDQENGRDVLGKGKLDTSHY